jgi:hypothetical protein
LKVLQILHHSASVGSTNFHQVMFDGWHARFGKELYKRSNCEVECLIFDQIIKKPFMIQKNGITYKAFTSSFSYAFLYEYSHHLIQYLKSSCQKRDDIILHVHGFPGLMTYAIASKFRDKVVVIQDHGGRLSGYMSIWIPLGICSLRNTDFFFRFRKR